MAQGAHAWVVLLVMSGYIANLAAQATTVQAPVQAVSSISSFAPPALPLCTRASPVLLAYLADAQPALFAALLPEHVFENSILGSLHALQAVQAGACAGALLPDYEAQWILGVNDTAGALCGVQPVGAPLSAEFVPMLFTPNTSLVSDAQLEAVNLVINTLQVASSGGASLSGPDSPHFPIGARQVCAPQDAADEAAFDILAPAQPLTVLDLGGIFVVQAVGLALAFICHASKGVRRRLLPCSRPHELLAEEEAQQEGAAAEAEEAQRAKQRRQQLDEEAACGAGDGQGAPREPEEAMLKPMLRAGAAAAAKPPCAPAPVSSAVAALSPTRRLTLRERMALPAAVRTTSDLSYITTCLADITQRLDELRRAEAARADTTAAAAADDGGGGGGGGFTQAPAQQEAPPAEEEEEEEEEPRGAAHACYVDA
jgi:hypothetical protein